MSVPDSSPHAGFASCYPPFRPPFHWVTRCDDAQAQGRNCKLTLYRHFAVVTCPVAASCFFSRAPTWLSICTNKLQHTPPQLSPIRASSFSSLPPTLQLPPVLLVLPKASIYLSTRFFSPPFLLELGFYLGGVTTSAYSHSNFRTRPAQKPYLGFQSLASFSSLLRHTHLIS